MAELARITTRGLGRALLARQQLLRRSPRPVVDEVAHLVALQSQNPTSAYLALHARTEGFTHADLAGAMLGRRVGRLALLRDTVHLVTARDALALWPLLAPMLRRRLTANVAATPTLRRVDLGDLRRAALDALADGPLSSRALGDRLAAVWPGLDPRALAAGARGLLPLVQVTPRGVWGRSLTTTWATADAWFGAPLVEPAGPDDAAGALAGLLRRYLAAYGPATVADAQRWSGLTGLRAVVGRAGLEEVLHTDGPGGRERVLLDLPGAPRPDPETRAPARLLPDFDEVLLGHDDRARIVPPEVRPALASRNGVPPGTVLLDGTVGGTWTLRRERLPRGAGPGEARAAGTGPAGVPVPAPHAASPRRDRAVLTVTPLRRWSRADRAAVLAEAEHVVRFVADDAAERAVALSGAG